MSQDNRLVLANQNQRMVIKQRRDHFLDFPVFSLDLEFLFFAASSTFLVVCSTFLPFFGFPPSFSMMMGPDLVALLSFFSSLPCLASQASMSFLYFSWFFLKLPSQVALILGSLSHCSLISFMASFPLNSSFLSMRNWKNPVRGFLGFSAGTQSLGLLIRKYCQFASNPVYQQIR